MMPDASKETGDFAAAYAAGGESLRSSAIEKIVRASAAYEIDIKGPDGQPLLKTQIEKDTAAQVAAILDQIPAGKPRRKIIRQVMRELRQDRMTVQAKLDGANSELATLRTMQEIIDASEDFLASAKILQSPSGTRLHKFIEAINDGEVIDWHDKNYRISDANGKTWRETASAATVYLIEHNWAAAFEGAGDFNGGEIHLPDDVCAFEFKISGVHIVAFATETDESIYLQYALNLKDKWMLLDVIPHALDLTPNDPPDSDYFLIAKTIRAVCIALDAEVAKTNIIRAPHKLNHARERRGQMPIFSYHVVSLARRERAPALEHDAAEAGARKRLHFRRGHWRHYPDHKTWIKWTLVGDPELGFVDKHYRL